MFTSLFWAPPFPLPGARKTAQPPVCHFGLQQWTLPKENTSTTIQNHYHQSLEPQ